MLKKISVLKYKIELLSGLHIGGYDSQFDIGGADSTVIKNPLTNRPFIPGSSLKGKIKSLLCYSNKYGDTDFNIGNNAVRNIFEPVDNNGSVAISRAIFRDLQMTDESAEMISSFLGRGVYTEIKAENKINIVKGTSDSPRFIERVPTGAIFDGEIILQIFEEDNEDEMKKAIEDGFELLEMNYLGGSGTRGYGRVKFIKNEWEDKNI